jgi:hypothetical protein
VFWKARIDSSESRSNMTLVGLTIQSTNNRLTLRMSFADGTFSDIDTDRLPRFDLGEIAHFSVHADVVVPTRTVLED